MYIQTWFLYSYFLQKLRFDVHQFVCLPVCLLNRNSAELNWWFFETTDMQRHETTDMKSVTGCFDTWFAWVQILNRETSWSFEHYLEFHEFTDTILLTFLTKINSFVLGFPSALRFILFVMIPFYSISYALCERSTWDTFYRLKPWGSLCGIFKFFPHPRVLAILDKIWITIKINTLDKDHTSRVVQY